MRGSTVAEKSLFGYSIILILLFAAAQGCNLLVPFAFLGEHKRDVPAEFDNLRGKRVVILVWAQPATMFDYPHIRLELASYIGDRIESAVKECEIVAGERVEELIERDLDAMIDPKKSGTHFQADMVVYIELLEFQVRDPETPDLLHGHIHANVSVYDLAAEPDELDRFVLAPIEVRYPDSPVILSARNALLVRQQLYQVFAEKAATKFFKHQVDLEDAE